MRIEDVAAIPTESRTGIVEASGKPSARMIRHCRDSDMGGREVVDVKITGELYGQLEEA